MLKSNIKFYSLKDKNPIFKLASIMIRDLNEGLCILAEKEERTNEKDNIGLYKFGT